MCLVYIQKKYNISFFLLFFILSLIIIKISHNLFAQEEKLRDPFLSLGDKIRLAQETEDISVLPYPIVINGIIWTENLPVAIINNDIVQQGEVWRDFKVEKIQRNTVVLIRGNVQFRIPLALEEGNEIKKD